MKTKSIIDQIELEFDKKIEDVTSEELSSIKDIIINGLNISGENQKIYVDDIKLFDGLESISIYNMEIDEVILEILKNINTLKYISFIECDIYDFQSVFYNVTSVEFSFCRNFNNDIFNCFPNITKLTLKGACLNYIPKSIKYLNIQNSKISNYEIFNNLKLEDLCISIDEYNNNPSLYKSLNARY